VNKLDKTKGKGNWDLGQLRMCYFEPIKYITILFFSYLSAKLKIPHAYFLEPFMELLCTHHHGGAMTLVGAVERLQIVYGALINEPHPAAQKRGSPCREAMLLLQLLHFLAATPELIGLRLALVDPQRGHVDVDADETP